MNNLNKNIITGNQEQDSLIEKAKTWDKKISKLNSLLGLTYIVLIGFSILMPFIDRELVEVPRKFWNWMTITSSMILILTGIIVDFYQFKRIFYSKPITEVLKDIIKRYRLFAPRYLFIIIGFIPLAFVMSGGIVSIFKLNEELVSSWIIAYGCFTLIFAVSMIVGYVMWMENYKPLLDQAKQILKSLLED